MATHPRAHGSPNPFNNPLAGLRDEVEPTLECVRQYRDRLMPDADLKLAGRSLQEILDRPGRITDTIPSWLGPDDRDRAKRGIYLVIEDRFAFPVTHMSMGEGRVAIACFVRRSDAASTFSRKR
jgi:hypothetical protein